MDFLSSVLAGLGGLAVNMAANISADAIYSTISREDLASLLERCLREALQEKANLLNRHTRPTVQGDPPPEAYLDAKALHDYLERNPVIEPLISEQDSPSPWRPYLATFRNIIVIPGCPLAESDQLDLIEGVLDLASRKFTKLVPYQQPAFEQLLLKYQQRHMQNHQRILAAIAEGGAQPTPPEREAVGPIEEVEVRPGRLSNPFSVVAADDLELKDPEHVRRIRHLFIGRYTDLPTISKRFHTILEGQRGTGKTMIMKYLAFETQIREWPDEEDQSLEAFLESREKFIGVYSKLRQGVYDKREYYSIDQSGTERLFEHRLCLQLIHDVLQTMRSVFSYSPPETRQFRRMKQMLGAYLKLREDIAECDDWQELVQTTQDAIDDYLVPAIDEYLGSLAPGARKAPLQAFSPWLTLSGQFIPFLRRMQDACGARVPFFIMLDDFDVLEAFQQSCIYRTAAERQFGVVCFKFGVMVLGRKTNMSGPNRTFRVGDDYDLIDLDWTEGGLHGDYRDAVLQIAEARLRDAGWSCDLADLLPEWEYGAKLKGEIRTEMQREWDEAEAEDKPSERRADYPSKYLNARYFQTLRQRGVGVRYAGLEQVLMVSSGIIRQFLEACKLILDRANDSGWVPDDGRINAEIQNGALREYSDQMMRHLTHTSGDVESLLSGDMQITSSHMLTLIESLCDVFYARLHTPGHGDPEIISIAVRDDLEQSEQARAYLNVAVRESILHRYPSGYTAKTPGGPSLPTFMLNRRLGPRRRLSISRMQGRIELDAEDIELAVSDRHAFRRRILGTSRPPQPQLPLQ